jgi:hypothetical protein
MQSHSPFLCFANFTSQERYKSASGAGGYICPSWLVRNDGAGSDVGTNGNSTQQTQQKTNTENSKQIFPEKELRGHSPNFHIHVSVSDLYIPTINLPILLQEICGPTLGIYKSLTDT